MNPVTQLHQAADEKDASAPTFTDLHAAYFPRVVRYLGRLVGEQDAEDVAQEVFLKVSRGLSSFRGDSSLETWILGIARYAGLDRLRQRAVRREEAHRPWPTPVESSEEAAAFVDDRPSAERHLIGEEMRACIQGRVDRLPEPYRSVLVFSESAGLSDAEIASQLGTTIGNVKIRLHRARARLREDLGCHCSLYRDERDELACEPKGALPSP